MADFILTNLVLDGTLTWRNIRAAQDLLAADLDLTHTALRAELPLCGGRSFGIQLSGLVECESCGCKYGHKTWHARTPNRMDVWECATNHVKRDTCATPHIYQEVLQRKLVEVVQVLAQHHSKIRKNAVRTVSYTHLTLPTNREV